MHKQLTLEQRHYIYMTRKKGQLIRDIVAELGMSHSTVSRELKRNTSKRDYQYQQANKLAQQRHMFKNKSVKMNQVLKRLIKNCLALGWSPEQICGWLKANHIINFHHVSVYRYLLKDKASASRQPYRKHCGYANNRTGIPDRVGIEYRSEAVNNREVFGHREADTMIGKAHQVAIVTIDERISKLRLAYPVKSKHKENVSAAIRTMLEPVAEAVDSITYDNGKEFSWHQQINKSPKCKSYFAKPYRSWEPDKTKMQMVCYDNTS